MNSEKVDDTLINACEKWKDAQPTVILDHSKYCCREAREWLLAMDQTLQFDVDVFSPPRWIREKYEWGPTKHPLYWCDCLKLEMLDCGALAALARAVFVNRGINVLPALLIQHYSAQNIDHWQESWMKFGLSVNWIHEDYIYHEACAVIFHETQIKIWDPTYNCWIHSDQSFGYGATLAVKIIGMLGNLSTIRWGKHKLALNKWVRVYRCQVPYD